MVTNSYNKKNYQITTFLSIIFFLMFFQVLNFDEEILVFFCLFSVFIILYSLLKEVLIKYFESTNIYIYNQLIFQLTHYQFLVSSVIIYLINYIRILDLNIKLYNIVKININKVLKKNYNFLRKIYLYIFNSYLNKLVKEEIIIWKLLYIYNIKRKFLFLRLFFKLQFLDFFDLKQLFINLNVNKKLFYYLYESFYLLRLKNNKLNI